MNQTAGFKSTKKGFQIHSPGIEGGEKEKGKKKWEGESGERKCGEKKDFDVIQQKESTESI